MYSLSTRKNSEAQKCCPKSVLLKDGTDSTRVDKGRILLEGSTKELTKAGIIGERGVYKKIDKDKLYWVRALRN